MRRSRRGTISRKERTATVTRPTRAIDGRDRRAHLLVIAGPDTGKMHSERNICLDVQWLDGELLERSRIRLHRDCAEHRGLTIMPRIFSTLLNREVDLTEAEFERRRARLEQLKKKNTPAPRAAAAQASEQPQPGLPMVVEVEVLERDRGGHIKRLLFVPKEVKLPPRGGGETLQ